MLHEHAHLPLMPTNRMVGIGAIGAGFIMTECHLPAYVAAGLRPVAIASRRLEIAQNAADRFGMVAYPDVASLLADDGVDVVDVAVPPDQQRTIIEQICNYPRRVRAILAQKPLGMHYREATEIFRMCRQAGIVLAVNQNMRYDHSVRACRSLLERRVLGEPVLATINMRAIPHWMPWQADLGWLTLRIMSIHHLDTFRYWFGDPERIYASVRPDPRTKFPHTDGVCLYILEYENGLRASAWDDVWAGPAREGAAQDLGIQWRVEGTEGLAKGEIGWPKYPERAPSTLDFTTVGDDGRWHQPRWPEVWFPDAFAGPMAELLLALERSEKPPTDARDNLLTMALVDAAYRSAQQHRAVEPAEIIAEWGVAD